MDAIERELSQTIRLLLKLGSYSESNAITIQHILERYHNCVDKLCAYDNVLFLNSVLIIALLEPKLKLLVSKNKPLMLRMQNFYETKKELQSSLMMDLKLYTMYIVKSKHAL